MNKEILILSILLIFVNCSDVSQCTCKDLNPYQSDCYLNMNCEWQAKNEYCQAIDDPCPIYKSREICDSINGCAWTDDSECSQFTQCTDYTIQYSRNAEWCYMKDSTCVPGEENYDGSVTCTKGKLRCSDIQDMNICGSVLIQNDGRWCAPINSQCEAVDVSSCSTITHVQLCLFFYCDWYVNQEICVAPLCSDYETEDTCSFIRSEYLGYAQMCAWCNNKCIEANNIQISESSTCYYRGEEGYYSFQSINYIGNDPNCTAIALYNLGQILRSIWFITITFFMDF